MTFAGVATAIDKLNRSIGRITAWLTLAMVLVTFCVVVLRYLFDSGWIWLQESVTWMHAAVFMLAAAYTLADDQHVRVDIFYRDMSGHGRALVNALGTALFLLPLTVFMIWTSWDYVGVSWEIHETSREAGGMVFPFPSIMKSFIPATAFLLLLQGIAMEARDIAILVARRSDQGPERL